MLCDLSHWLALVAVIVAGVSDVSLIQYAMVIGATLFLANIRIRGGDEETLADGTLLFAIISSAVVAAFGLHPLPFIQAIGLVVGYVLSATLDGLAWKPAWHPDGIPIYPRSLGEKALEMGIARGSVITCNEDHYEVVEIGKGGVAVVVPSAMWNHPLARQTFSAFIGGAVMVLIQAVL